MERKIKNQNSKISVVIIARNEEKKFRDCLESIKWVGEVVVIDNASIDKTAEIAKKFDAAVYKVPEEYSLNYSRLRNLGLEKSTGKWVLYLDADERVTEDLMNEILSLASNHRSQITNLAYAIPRRNIIFGREMRYGGQWPDFQKRLFLKKELKKWVGPVHEEPIFNGRMGHLNNPLLHIKHDNLTDMLIKTNNWSEIEAKLMFKAHHPQMNIPRFLSAIFREFWLRMIRQKAFLDGTEGVIYAIYQVYSKFISYTKLWEMQRKVTGNT